MSWPSQVRKSAHIEEDLDENLKKSSQFQTILTIKTL